MAPTPTPTRTQPGPSRSVTAASPRLGGVWTAVGRWTDTARAALGQLGPGLETSVLALVVLVWVVLVALACLVGVGLLAVPGTLRTVRRLADRERGRPRRWGGPLLGAGPAQPGLREAATDPTTRREMTWLVLASTVGLVFNLVGVLLPIYALRDLSFPLWWQLLPAGDSRAPWWWAVTGWTDAAAVSLLGVVWAALTIGLVPRLAQVRFTLTRRLLAPPPGTDLPLRVAELTATRAAALDAHVVELSRIERSLHDGTQNRLVAVTVLLGAARRALARDGAGADELLERAQDAAEQALGELRAVARGILPPVLVDRGLAEALSGLVAGNPVPTTLDVDVAERCPVSVEATAWFVVAEALTNVTKHSGATAAHVTVHREGDRLLVRVTDDGHGGAALDGGGSGLSGIRRRVAAHDGTLTVRSPPGGPTVLDVEVPCGS